MKAVNYLKQRFEFAFSNKKPIYPNEKDVDAINAIIDLANGATSELEEGLILYYILGYWKLEMPKNKLKFEEREDKLAFFEMASINVIMKQLRQTIRPKKLMIDELYNELLTIQMYVKSVAKREKEEIADFPLITKKEIEDYFEEVLTHFKGSFDLFKFKTT